MPCNLTETKLRARGAVELIRVAERPGADRGACIRSGVVPLSVHFHHEVLPRDIGGSLDGETQRVELLLARADRRDRLSASVTRSAL